MIFKRFLNARAQNARLAGPLAGRGQLRRTAIAAMVATFCLGAAPTTAPQATRFSAVEIWIDPKGQPLAAWQLEFAAGVGQVSLVGVEAGAHPAYAARPPYYDPAALAGNRVIVGDYSLAADLPKSKARVATLMLEIRGDAKPQYATKLMAAADADGKPIAAEVKVIER
jgi:hypothetical protein